MYHASAYDWLLYDGRLPFSACLVCGAMRLLYMQIGGEAETLLEKQRARRRESARRSRQKKKSTMQSLQDDLTRLHDEVQQLKEKDHVMLALLQESTAPADLAALLARRDAALRARAAARPHGNAEGLDHSAPSDGGAGEVRLARSTCRTSCLTAAWWSCMRRILCCLPKRQRLLASCQLL